MYTAMTMNIHQATKHGLLALLLGLLVFPSAAMADSVVRSGATVEVKSDEVVAEDYYALANSIALSGEIKGDVHVVGGQITVNGPIGSDLFAVAGGVQLHAPVADDVRLIAGEVVIAEPIAGDVFVFANSLEILSTASVGGDVFFFGGGAKIAGAVGGSVMGVYTDLRIDSAVAGTVEVSANQLVLGEKAVIAGNLLYESPVDLVRAQAAVVEGDVIKQGKAEVAEKPFDSRFVLVPFLISLFCSLTLYLILRRHLSAFLAASQPFAQRTLIGMLGLIALFFVSLVLFGTVLGLWLGVLGILFFLLTGVFAYLLFPIVLGAVLSGIVSSKPTINTLTVLIGVIVAHLIAQIPVIGLLVLLSGFALIAGTFFTLAFRWLR